MGLTDVLDGESTTIALGETSTDHAWALPGTGSCDKVPNSGGRFSSEHVGGAYFVFCDGPVKFLSTHIDRAMFRARVREARRAAFGRTCRSKQTGTSGLRRKSF